MALIIVESPTKARTFNRILKGENYYVFATMGHIRDLPASSMSIDYDNKFQPDYHIIANKKKVVDGLKKLAKEHDEVILATDPDREGESISYHAAYILGLIKEKWPDITIDPKKPLKRIVFHEITQNALREALEHPEELRIDLVKAQQARRILDRIVGYELSPLLWKKMGKNWLSAGRVQSVALRIIVEREKEIRAFKIEDYYQIYGNFKNKEPIRAKLVSKDDVLYEQKFKIDLFAGEYEYTKTTISKDNVEGIQKDVQVDTYKVLNITENIKPRYPPPPFTTSLLQQDSFQKFGFVLTFAAIFVSLGLYEPKIDTRKYKLVDFIKQNVTGFRELFSSLRVANTSFTFIILAAGYFVASSLLGISQAREYGMDSRAVGIIFAIGYLISAITSYFYPQIKKALGTRVLLYGVGILLIGSFIFAKFVGVFVGVILIISRIASSTTFRNTRSVEMNKYISSENRATAISTMMLLSQLPYAVLAYFIGDYIDRTSPNNFAFILGITMIGLLVLQQIVVFALGKRAGKNFI